MPEQIIELEPEKKLLAVVDSRLEANAAQSLVAAFRPFAAQVDTLVKQTESVTSPKVARAVRLELKTVRVAIDKTRKAQKESALLFGRTVDGMAALLELQIKGPEAAMEAIEKAEEIREAQRKAALKSERETSLAPYGVDLTGFDCGNMPDATWLQLLENTKAGHERKLEEARKAEAARIEAENARLKEEQRLRDENERLQREAAAREEQARKERAEAEAKLASERAAAKAEQDRIEAAARAEREAAEKAAREAKAKADAERAEIERNARAAAELLAKVQREAEAKAKAERDEAARVQRELEAKARREREAAEAQAREVARLEAEAKARAEEEQRRIAHEKAEQEKAAAGFEAWWKHQPYDDGKTDDVSMHPWYLRHIASQAWHAALASQKAEQAKLAEELGI